MNATCRACGQEIASPGRFCPSCGAALDPVAVGRESRKIVTVLFADISGSTAMGERLDAEAVRSLLARHFSRARTILERHGGTVEKFIGDAVMAVFGIPRAHEDDALRAVRAALEMQAGVADLNADPATASMISLRIGINTGEVVAGNSASETLVTGDTVNTAARLEQAAGPGEVLIGARTAELVREAVDATRQEPITARGKSEPIDAFRVLSLTGHPGRRRSEHGRLVGRRHELAALASAFERVGAGSGTNRVTVIAPAGVGKSRLVREFIGRVESAAMVVRGRCLPYGDGITYWPIREMVHQLATVDEWQPPQEVRARLDDMLDGEPEVADTVAAVIGLESRLQRQEEVFWGVRRLLERVATLRPLVLVVEDLHWAEETLLDLLEYITSMATRPILLVATARPELVETRPTWGATGSLLRLEPLAPGTAEELLLAQDGGAAVSPDVRKRILEIADGNPLFLEEMVAMLRERGRSSDDREVAIPATVQALLAARLDQLASDERAVLEHGAVIGRAFEASAVAEIAPTPLRDRLTRLLLALVRRELLRPERADLTSGDAYRFRHILIRDAAYQAIAKQDRAVLHEHFARWLESVAGERLGEYEEIIGHHLEQALIYRRELGETGREALSQMAASSFLRAGLGAVRRDDRPAAITLLEKARDLSNASDTESLALLELLELYSVAGAFDRAEGAAKRILEIAEASADHAVAAIARIHLVSAHRYTQSATWVAEANRILPEAIRILEQEGDEYGISLGWLVRSLAAYPDPAKTAEYAERAYEHALAAGEPRQLGWAMTSVSSIAITGDEPVEDALPKVARLAAEARALGRLFAASIEVDLAVVESMAGRYEVALQRVEAARAVHREFRHEMELAESTTRLLYVHEFGGFIERAEPALREAIVTLKAMGERDLGPYLTAHLARLVAQDGRPAEARRLVGDARVDEADPIRELLSRIALAYSHAAEGTHDEAGDLAHSALELVPAHASNRRATTLLDFGRVLAAGDRIDEARQAMLEARALAGQKGNVGLIAVIDRYLPAARAPT